MKAKKYWIITTVVVISCVMVFAKTEKPFEYPKFSTTVKLKIQADEDIQNQIYSYISRELRSLGDVEIVEDNPEWIIQILALNLSSKEQKVGVVLSTLILTPYRLGIFRGTLLNELSEDKYNTFKQTTSGLYYIIEHLIYTGSDEDIRSNCQRIVVDFDSEQLQADRKRDKEIEEIVKKWRQEKAQKETPKDEQKQ